MVNFGLLSAEIGSAVWGIPANFNGFRVLAALLHGSQLSNERQSNFAALNRGRHLCSAGRPSRWALAHILVFPRLISAVADWTSTMLRYFYTWCGCSPNLECRSEVCCRRLAGNAGPKKSPKIRHLGTIAELRRAVSSQRTHTIDNRKKKLVKQQCVPHISSQYGNMVNFGPLGTAIGPVFWGTPANFNGFRVLAALMHGTPVLGVSQTLRRWTESTTYIRWALARISSYGSPM